MSEASIDISEKLEQVAVFAIDEGLEKVNPEEGFAPFIIVVKGEEMFVESFPEGEPKECFAAARAELARERSEMQMYALAYDGYVETEDGDVDAVIVEVAEKGAGKGHAIGRMYHLDGEDVVSDESLLYLGEIPSIFEM